MISEPVHAESKNPLNRNKAGGKYCSVCGLWFRASVYYIWDEHWRSNSKTKWTMSWNQMQFLQLKGVVFHGFMSTNIDHIGAASVAPYQNSTYVGSSMRFSRQKP